LADVQDTLPPAPPPAPPPPPTPPPPPPPPAATERPEWLPENLWDATENKPVDFSTLRQPPADLPSTADAYTLPTVEGVELDAADPLIGILRTRAFANGLGQEEFAGIISDYAVALKQSDDAAYEREMGQLGENRDARVTAVSNWLGAQIPAEEAKALTAGLTTAAAVQGLERLMNKGVLTPREPGPMPTNRKTEAQIRDLMNTPAYSGRASERQEAVIAEVTKWFEDEERLKAAQPAPAKP
jgi:hypothetical protein